MSTVMYDAEAFAEDANGRDLKRGARVEILSSGERGRVRDVDGNYVVVEEDGGHATRLAARDVRAFEVSTMAAVKEVGGEVLVQHGPADKSSVEDKLRRAGISWRDQARGKVVDASADAVRAALGSLVMHDLTEVCVEPDGAVEVCVDPSGDEARAGALNYERSAACPYCSKSVALFGRKLGDHRVHGGICDGAGRAVARVEMGRAVLMAEEKDSYVRINRALRLYRPGTQSERVYWSKRIDDAKREGLITDAESRELRQLIVQ